MTPEAGLQRLLLALAVRGDVLAQAAEAVTPVAFGAGATTPTPRQRLAGMVSTFWIKYQTRPAPEALEQAVAEERLRLGPAEAEELTKELAAVLETEIPDEPAWIYDRARQWADIKRLEGALATAQRALATTDPVQAARAAREAMAAGMAPAEKSAGVMLYVGQADERLALWRSGLAFGQYIPTGLPELDRAAGGGIAKKETWYFLAPPKGAKTTFLLRAAFGAARRGFGVYVATFEMQDVRMALRQDRALARQTKEELVDGTDELQAAIAGLRAIGAEIFIEAWPPEMRGSVAAVRQRVKQLRRAGHRIDLGVFDYLSIMGSAKPEREKRFEMTSVSREISTMAKEDDLAILSAVLVNRKAVDKPILRKADIAEAFEVVAVVDGMVAICGTPGMVAAGVRSLWVAASRESQEETLAGSYRVDFARATVTPIGTPTPVDNEGPVATAAALPQETAL